MGHDGSAFRGYPLSNLKEVRGAVDIDLLDQLSIFDAEQLLGVLTISGIRGRLARSLRITVRDLDHLAGIVRNVLPRAVVFNLGEAVNPPYPLGAFTKPTAETKRLVRSLQLREPPGRASEHPAANNLAMLGPVKNQGARGTCVAFAATALHERYFSDTAEKVSFSQQYLYAKIKSVDQHPNECGTWLVYAAKILVESGQCMEGGGMTYNPNLPCNDTNPIQPPFDIDARQYRIDIRMLQANNVSLIKDIIVSGGVVPVCIPVFNSWYRSPETERSGRITMPIGSESSPGGHCFCLAGFQNAYDVPGGGYFIVRNSWGTSWGRDCPYGAGNGVIPYAYISALCTEAATGPPIGS